MDPGQSIQTPPAPAEVVTVSRLRWWLHLGLIGLYPILMVAIGEYHRGTREEAILPGSVGGLLKLALVELILFGLVFGVGWLASRASVDQLMLRWRGRMKPVLLGLLYSVALRAAVMLAVFLAMIVFFAGWIVKNGSGSRAQMEVKIKELAQKGRPKIENLVNAKALNDPVYLAVMLTLVCFGVAGLREELWRAGVLAGMGALFPRWYSRKTGKIFAITLVAVAFGLCHLPQGWGAVALTGVLGLGLGGIMVFHQSTWIAVIAHGVFDATTFVGIVLLGKFDPKMIEDIFKHH